jgi:hypothetical protein
MINLLAVIIYPRNVYFSAAWIPPLPFFPRISEKMPYNYLYAKLYFVYISYFAQKLKLSMEPENAPAGRTAGGGNSCGILRRNRPAVEI